MQVKEEIKLKPCPFCDSDLIVLDEISDWVDCQTCYATASFECWQNPTGRISENKSSELENYRQLCKSHPNVNYKHAWGCPDCVAEMRTFIKWLKAEIDGLEGRDATFDLSHSFVENLRNQIEELEL